MHVRTKFRKPNGLVTPKGPSFSSAKKICINLDGTILSFKAPKHRPRRKGHKSIQPEHNYKFEEMIFRSSYRNDSTVNDNWKTYKLFYRSWAFYGPWFTGTLADLWMFLELVKPVNYENSDFSLFNPRAFENIVADFMTNNYSKYTDSENDKQLYITPVEWQPLTHLPVIGVRFQVIPDESVTYSTIEHLVFFPITDKVMAYIHFTPSQIRAASQEENDKRVSRSTMYKLMDNIIDSIQLTLSPVAQAQQKTALAGLSDTSLVKEFMPLQWRNTNPESAAKKLETKTL